MYLNLHMILQPFYSFFLYLAYISSLSKWISALPKLEFNDFYNRKVSYKDRFKLHEFVFKTHNLSSEINYFEFGVAEGTSFKWWLNKNKNPNSRFYGFDTFTGLPENFGIIKKTHYDTKGIFPEVNDNRAQFIPGLFQDSFPGFFKNFNFTSRSVFHIDADLYSSALFIFTYLVNNMKKDDIIIFDEFGVPTHEFKAFTDFISAYPFKYQVIGAVNNYLQIAIKVI